MITKLKNKFHERTTFVRTTGHGVTVYHNGELLDSRLYLDLSDWSAGRKPLNRFQKDTMIDGMALRVVTRDMEWPTL